LTTSTQQITDPTEGRGRRRTRDAISHASRVAVASAAQPSTIPTPTSTLISARARLKKVAGGSTT
jgi:hypothetical protein